MVRGMDYHNKVMSVFFIIFLPWSKDANVQVNTTSDLISSVPCSFKQFIVWSFKPKSYFFYAFAYKCIKMNRIV